MPEIHILIKGKKINVILSKKKFVNDFEQQKFVFFGCFILSNFNIS